jgi:hypothetical protein
MLTWTYLQLLSALNTRAVELTNYTPLSNDDIAAIEQAERIYTKEGERGLRRWYREHANGDGSSEDSSLEQAS